MRINTNVAAINAYRNLSETNRNVSKSMEKLSSGFRINHASDDAAGLGIANKLRADISSMTQASRNAEQANSLLQVAEGSVGTIQKMLERMKELATQAGSDTVDASGRTRLQEEFSKLQEEITRTVETTKFQGVKLLKGTAGTAAVAAVPAGADTPAVDGVGDATAAVGVSAAASIDFAAGTLVAGTYTITDDGTDITVLDSGNNVVGTASSAAAGATVTIGGLAIVLGASYDNSAAGTRFDGTQSFDVTSAYVALVPGSAAVPAVAAVPGSSQSFLVSSSAQYTDGLDAITVDGINLELTTLGITADTLGTLASARTALTNVDAAMEKVNSALGKIGAAQNRIIYAQDNLKTAIQNFSAAESVIRDVDMAEEMTKFSKNSILAQAGTAMLAQANQSAQGVLQLLRG